MGKPMESLYSKGYRWLARTKEGGLYAFKNKPHKIFSDWLDPSCSWIHIAENGDEYAHIKSDDIEPVLIESPDDPDEEPDNVNHPQHYKHGEIETLDIIRMSLTAEEFQGFLKGNVLKYQLRAPFKHETPDEDYAKAKYYYDEYREVTE